MDNKEKLRELLCTVPEIEKDIKELRFGCWILTNGLKDKVRLPHSMIYRDDKIDMDYYMDYDYKVYVEEIIGNPLQERHLRMYCEYGKINFNIAPNGDCFELYDNTLKLICKLDNTKDLENQSEETLGKILNFLQNSL